MDSSRVITSLDQVNPEWLTTVLSNSGALTSGAVAAIESNEDRGNWSTNANLRVRYGEGSQRVVPQRLFLKQSLIACDDLDCSELWQQD